MDLDQYTLDSLAQKAAAQYLEKGTHPNDIVLSLATANSLNDEQARRLCEATNVAIKRYKTYEEHDPQAEFPLADWKVVVSGLVDGTDEEMLGEDMGNFKEASFGGDDWEIFEELMGDNELHLEKDASSQDWDPKKVVAVVEMLKQAEVEAAGFRVQSEVLKKSAAAEMLRYLRESAINEQNINQAYTISLEKIGSQGAAQHEAVEVFFDSAHDLLSTELNIKMAELQLVPIHGTINPSWTFLKNLHQYIGSTANMKKLASVENTIHNQLDSLIKSVGVRMAQDKADN